MAFRIGRKHAAHTYPEPPTGAGLPLLQIGSDLLDEDFGPILGNNIPVKVAQSAGPPAFLQVPLPDFQRINGLWFQFSATISIAETGPATIRYFPWVKFATLPQFFGVTAVVLETIPTAAIANPTGVVLTLDLCCLIKLPAATIEPVILIPAEDDILVGIAGVSADANFNFIGAGATLIAAGEINSSIITQMPEVVLFVLP